MLGGVGGEEARERRRVLLGVVAAAVVEEHVDVCGGAREPLNGHHQLRELALGIEVVEAIRRARQAGRLSALRPCRRTTASRGCVTAQTCGTLKLESSGSSTTTFTTPSERSKARVRSRFLSLNQLLLRSSTATS